MHSPVPFRAWLAVAAGMSINLCLGILYAWSVWKKNLIATADNPAGTPMTGLNAGWHYLSDAQATWAYALCGFTFALFMIPGGRVQDRYGPRAGSILAGVFLLSGCLLAGFMQSYMGLILGFGILAGIGMGFGYAAATPAAVKWFGPQRRGLIVGLVVAGYGAAAIYIAPLATFLIKEHGLTASFYGLGAIFAGVICVGSFFLRPPPAGYVAPGAATVANAPTVRQWSAGEMLHTWQYYLLVFLFIGSAQAGLLVIANAVPILNATAGKVEFFAQFAWILASFGGLVNASGRIGTGFYSDKVGRMNAFAINGLICAACLFATPYVMGEKNIPLLFVVVGVAFWQYGGTLSLMPALTADYYGSKNLGLNYGLVFLGWGLAFFVPQLAGYLKDVTGTLDIAFYISGGILLAAVAASRVLRKPG